MLVVLVHYISHQKRTDVITAQNTKVDAHGRLQLATPVKMMTASFYTIRNVELMMNLYNNT